MSSLSNAKTNIIIVVLGLLTIFPPLATDMYLSAITDLAISFNTSHSAAAMSLSLFFFGLCIGQLIIGPLIDSYGRKLPLLIGVLIFCISSLGLIYVDTIWQFNSLRILQAIGACSGMVVSRAIVNDLFEGVSAAKVMTILVMILTIGPVISPTIGSLLLESFGWKSIFVCMTVIGVISLLLTWQVIPETLSTDDRVKAPFKSAAKIATTLIRNKAFIMPTLIAGLIQGGMFSFITGSSGVFQGVYGLSSIQFGLTFAAVALALIVFGQINTYLLNKYTPLFLLKLGLYAQLVISVALLLASLTSSLLLLIVTLWFAIGLVSLISANAMALAMGASRAQSGVGSALLGAIQFCIAFLVSFLVALAESSSSVPMALGFLIPICITLVISSNYLKLEGNKL